MHRLRPGSGREPQLPVGHGSQMSTTDVSSAFFGRRALGMLKAGSAECALMLGRFRMSNAFLTK